MKLRSLYLLILFFISASSFCFGGDISFRATVNRNTISRSDRLIYTLTIEGVRGVNPILPDIPGFEVQDSSVSTKFSLVKNQTKVRKSITYNLLPIEVGTFTIPSAHLEYGGKTYSTRPIKVKVVAGAGSPTTGRGRPIQHPGQSVAANDESLPPAQNLPLFIRTEVDKKESYINEEIILTVMLLYHGCQPTNLECDLPKTTDFAEKYLGKPKCYTRVISGVQYKVAEWKKAIFPSRTGELTIGPAQLKGYILDPEQPRKKRKQTFSRDRGFYDFFPSKSLREKHPFIRNSDPIKLSIKPLPEKGRMENFSNAVGSFEFELSANPTTVTINDPITVTITISGIGNMDSVRLPDIDYGENFSVYNQDIEVKKKVIGEKTDGEKIFKQIIIPRSIDLKEIPAVTISYFDPSTSSYRLLNSKAIPIKVDPLPPAGEQLK